MNHPPTHGLSWRQRLAALGPGIIELGLGRIAEALHALEDPHETFPRVTIAGTNGKGSTATYLARMLTSMGVRTGLYTSPHLVDPRERVRVEGHPMEEEAFEDTAEEVLSTLERLGLRITYFEAMTCIALVHFARQRVDVAVMEVGLGGRLDATNVAPPILSLITRVGLDHRDVLGDEIAAQAREKAGIIHPGVPVIRGPQLPEAASVIDAVAREMGAPLEIIGRRRGRRKLPSFLATSSSLADAALRRLQAKGICPRGVPDRELVLRPIPGRMEHARVNGLEVILDVGHNPDAMAVVAESARARAGARPLVVAFALQTQKDVHGCVEALAPARPLLFVSGDGDAFHSPHAVMSDAKVWGLRVEEADGFEEAVEDALASGREEQGLVVVTGSHHMVGAAKRLGVGLDPLASW